MLLESDGEDGALPADDHYTGVPCRVCGRIRVYLRRDGQAECEKCGSLFPVVAPEAEKETRSRHD